MLSRIKEHCNMVRGLVPKERLLEWQIGDGWEPLCEFLDKPVPDVPFPYANTKNMGWKEREQQAMNRWVFSALKNALTLGAGFCGLGAIIYKQLC